MSNQSALYGQPRKKPATSTTTKTNSTTAPPSSSTLAFTTTLSNLIAQNHPSSSPSGSAQPQTNNKPSTTTGRPRPSKHNKPDDIFSRPNRGAQKRAARDLDDRDDAYAQTQTQGQIHQQSKDLGGKVEEAVLQRSKRRLAEKARVYEDLRRGLYLLGSDDESSSEREGEGEGERYLRGLRRREREGLVDFDRLAHDSSLRDGEEEGENDDDDDDASIVSYEDELGRSRKGTRAQAAEAARLKHSETEEGERWRPARPENLIYGVTVQSEAFQPDTAVADHMAYLAKRRDRSATPPEETHYDAEAEVRNRGTGFYAFSKDEETRKRQMEELRAAREETQREREEKLRRRARKEDARTERMKKVEELRSKRRAELFLAGLGDVGVV